MNRKDGPRRDAYLAHMRDRMRVLQMPRYNGGKRGPICHECHSILGCRRTVACLREYFVCRACDMRFTIQQHRTEKRLSLPHVWRDKACAAEQRRRDLRAVYWRDRLPFNATTRRAMTKR